MQASKQEILDQAIEELADLNVNTYNNLRARNIVTIGDVVKLTRDELQRDTPQARRMTKGMLADLEGGLAKLGLSLRPSQ